VAQWVIPRLMKLAESSPEAKPSLLVTNSLLYVQPVPFVFSLTMVKAAQRALVQCLDMTYREQGVHVGLISVGGQVDPKNKVLNPSNIAEKSWDLYNQKRNEWTLEVELLGDQEKPIFK